MTGVRLSKSGQTSWKLIGDLDFSTVPGVWPEIDKRLSSGGRLSLSLAGVRQSNSAGVALLLEAREVARRRGCRLLLTHLPPGLIDLARMSSCDRLITTNP